MLYLAQITPLATAGFIMVVPVLLADPAPSPLHKRLRDRIISCELIPGQRISETEIASTYEVSRQPVREAFIKLSEENLVRIRPQRGTYIKPICVESALTARFIREAVESDLVRLVVERATPEMISVLDAQLELQSVTAKADHPSKFMQLDETFHQLLAQYAGAPSVSEYLEGLNLQMNRVRNISAREFSPQKLVAQHKAIVDAIRLGDATTADSAMREHLQEIIKDLPQVVKTYPDYFEGAEALNKI